jgi:hypothetical protein
MDIHGPPSHFSFNRLFRQPTNFMESLREAANGELVDVKLEEARITGGR